MLRLSSAELVLWLGVSLLSFYFPVMATKKAAKKKVSSKSAVKKTALSPVKEAMTKTQLLSEIADKTDLTKKQVQSVLDEVSNAIERHIKKRGIGHFAECTHAARCSTDRATYFL